MVRPVRVLLSTIAFLFAALLPSASRVSSEEPPADSSSRLVFVLKSWDIEPVNRAFEGFRLALADDDAETSYLSANLISTDPEREGPSPEAILGFLEANAPDLVFTLGSAATEFAYEHIKETPVVFAMVLDPVGSGFVASYDRPSGNMTGVSMDIPLEIQFQTLRDILPEAQTLGVLYSPEESATVINQASLEATKFLFELVAVPVRSDRDIPAALEGLAGRIDALWAVADSRIFTSHSTEFILLHTIRHGIPFMGVSPSFVKAGALVALTCDYEDLGRQSGEQALRILGGTPPGGVPVALPRKSNLAINLRTAEHIGVVIPPLLTQQAATVFR